MLFTSDIFSTTISEVLGHCVGKRMDLWTQTDKTRAGRILLSLGWERHKKRCPGNRFEWLYRNGFGC